MPIIPEAYRHTPDSITAIQAVRHGVRLFDTLAQSYTGLPLDENWRTLLLRDNGQPKFQLHNPYYCIATVLCGTELTQSPYTEAIRLLDIDFGWRFGLDLPPTGNPRYGFEVLTIEWVRQLKRNPAYRSVRVHAGAFACK